MLRTVNLCIPSNICPARALVCSHNIRLDNVRLLDLDEEYLVWDGTPYPTFHTSLMALREYSLDSLLPESKQRMHKVPLPIELKGFRKKLFDESWDLDITPKETQIASTPAEVLMGRPDRHLTLQLLCTRRRSPRDPVFSDILRDDLVK